MNSDFTYPSSQWAVWGSSAVVILGGFVGCGSSTPSRLDGGGGTIGSPAAGTGTTSAGGGGMNNEGGAGGSEVSTGGGGASGGSGGVSSRGGAPPSGGFSGEGGGGTGGQVNSSGGADGGIAGVGGVAIGGNPATGGSSNGGAGGATACGVPKSFKWSSSAQLISPDSSHVSIKDPSIVRYNGLWHVFASQVDASGNYSITYLNFSDWSNAHSAKQTKLTALGNGYRAAPQVFFFTPQNKWYLIYDGGPSYSVSDDISNPSAWSTPTTLASNGPAGWLDHWVICDALNCYLFGSADDGKWYRNQTTVAKFPSGWGGYTVVLQSSTASELYEASNVYKMKGTDQYLALIEAFDSSSGNKRFFRSWTAKTLDGTWTALADTYANPFASASNVSFTGTPWTSDISHGEMLRDGVDETLTIDTCDLQYLYQGIPPGSTGSYNSLPWNLGLLTPVQ